MSRPAKGPRLYLRRRKGRAPVWVIRDTGRPEVSTGTDDREEADQALARYIQGGIRRSGPATPEQLTCGEALAFYGDHHAPTVADPVRIGYAIQALDPFWGDLHVSEVKGSTCRRYAAWRGENECKPGTARKELGTLSAALRYCVKEGHLTSAPDVTLPKKPLPKERWLTRDEVARLIWAAWRNPRAKHVARFILVGVYTGTRKDAILRMMIDTPNAHGGWIDLERGRVVRRGRGEAQTKKRQPEARCPARLLAHARRWKRMGLRYVAEVDGARPASIKTAWRTARIAAGLDPDVTPHSLRRTAATWLMKNGADRWDAAGFLGMSQETLESIYAQHHPDFQADAAERIGRK